jgi:hypothetical protein
VAVCPGVSPDESPVNMDAHCVRFTIGRLVRGDISIRLFHRGMHKINRFRFSLGT